MSRSHETRIVIDAPMEEVWKSIAEAGGLARWFAPQMIVEAGAGGSMLADWGPGLAWKTAIEVWEPNRHLRLSETRDQVMSSAPGEQNLEPCRLIQDWYLESENGKTVLRLVHSGFGSSADWDTEYFGTKYGWASCFLRLKHVTEYHRTEAVHNWNSDAPLRRAMGRSFGPHRSRSSGARRNRAAGKIPPRRDPPRAKRIDPDHQRPTHTRGDGGLPRIPPFRTHPVSHRHPQRLLAFATHPPPARPI